MAVRKSTDNFNLDQDERKEKDRQKKDVSRSKRTKSDAQTPAKTITGVIP